MARLKLRERKAKRTRRAGEDALAFTTGMVFGGLVGSTAAIILAPTDGQTLRNRLRERIGGLLGGGAPDASIPTLARRALDGDRTPVAAPAAAAP